MYNANKDFDIVEFAIGIIKTVDSIRTTGKGGTTPYNSSEEPRINAFYRAIGLPAINGEQVGNLTGNKQGEKKNEKYRNNGNFMQVSGVNPNITSALSDLDLRKMVSMNLVHTANNAAKERFDIDTVNPKDSIDSSKKTERPQLFPMYVDDTIEIYGLDRRVSGAFVNDDARKQDKTELHIPFLEFIISLRVKETGFYNQSTQSALSSQIYGEFDVVKGELEKEIKNSLKNVGAYLSLMIDRINNARTNTSIQVSPDPYGHAEQNTVTKDDDKVSGPTDEQIKEQERYMAIKEARLLLFNFDDTSISGVVQNKLGTIAAVTRNLKKSILASQFLSMVLSDGGAFADAKKETEEKRDKYKEDLKRYGGELDLIFGTYSGLSVIDVLAVIYALFKMKIEDLISLLNDDSIARLNKIFGSNVRGSGQESAVTKLETIVKDIIEKEIAPQIISEQHTRAAEEPTK